jgi:hypothetical protein
MKLPEDYLKIILSVLIAIAIFSFYSLAGKDPTADNYRAPSDKPDTNRVTDGQRMLKPPSASASAEEKKIFSALVNKSAVAASDLNLSGCKSDPLVFKTSIKNNIKVRNNDSTEHMLTFSEKPIQQYKITAKSTVTLSSAALSSVFDKGPGIYGYGCDMSPSGGLFLVTP